MKTNRFTIRHLIIALLSVAAVASAQASKFRNPVLPDSVSFKLAYDAKVSVGGEGRSATLASVKPGDHVGLTYTEQNGVRLIHRLHDLGAAPEKEKLGEFETLHPKSTAKETERPKADHKNKNQTVDGAEVISRRKHGIVSSVDPVSGFVVLNVHPQAGHNDELALPHGKIKKLK